MSTGSRYLQCTRSRWTWLIRISRDRETDMIMTTMINRCWTDCETHITTECLEYKRERRNIATDAILQDTALKTEDNTSRWQAWYFFSPTRVCCSKMTYNEVWSTYNWDWPFSLLLSNVSVRPFVWLNIKRESYNGINTNLIKNVVTTLILEFFGILNKISCNRFFQFVNSIKTGH